MKQTLFFLTLLLAGTLSAQVEHWKLSYSVKYDWGVEQFGDSEESEPFETQMEVEVYAERGKQFMSLRSDVAESIFGNISSRSFVDSSQQLMLQLNDVMGKQEYKLYYFPEADVPYEVERTAPDGTKYTVVPNRIPERENKIEGVDFEVLKQTKRQSGLVLQKIKLMMPEEGEEAEAWVVKGKMLGIERLVFKNGEVGSVVESEINYGGTVIRMELVSFEEVKEMPEGLFSMEIPEGYEDADRNMYADELPYAEEYDYEETYEPYVPSGKPEPETETAEQWKLYTSTDYDTDIETEIFVTKGKYRVDRGIAYGERITIVDSSVYWRMEIEDHGYAYYRLPSFFGSKANNDSLPTPRYITEKQPKDTAMEGEAFRLLGDTRTWNGLKLYHVAMLTWKDAWAQGDGWLLMRELPGLDEDPLFVLRDGRKGTLLEYDFQTIGSLEEPRPDSVKTEVPETLEMGDPVTPVLTESPVEDAYDNVPTPDEEAVDWNSEVPEVDFGDDWYDSWAGVRWDSSQEDFDGPLPEIPATDEPYGIYDEPYYESYYPQWFSRKLMVYGKTVVSGKLFSLTPGKEYYDRQDH